MPQKLTGGKPPTATQLPREAQETELSDGTGQPDGGAAMTGPQVPETSFITNADVFGTH